MGSVILLAMVFWDSVLSETAADLESVFPIDGVPAAVVIPAITFSTIFL